MDKYTQEDAIRLNKIYSSGLNAKDSCKQAGIPYDVFGDLMRKFGFKIRAPGFQLGNRLGHKFLEGPSVEITCKICGVVFVVKKHLEQSRKYCSRACFNLHKWNSGPDHWNWKGGISNRWDSLHNSKEYKDWRMRVFRRDRFLCQKCRCGNSKNNRLHAHHIEPKSIRPDLILDVNNGQTLCKSCHIEVHKSLNASKHGRG